MTLAAHLTACEITAHLRQRFRESHGQEPRLFSAPGRVNLIGEHTDYNDGFVLPMAIEQRTFVAGLPRTDRVVTVQSLNAGIESAFELDRPGPKQRGSWVDYVEGTAQALLAEGWPLGGADIVIWSNVPTGAGLSASAALEISVGYALAQLASLPNIDRVSLARAGQRAEHDYVGTRCGIMDQYTAALAQPACALLLDCRSLERQDVDLNLDTACLLICDTKVKHDLATSAYNARRAECEEGIALLGDCYPDIRALRDVSWDALAEVEHRLPPTIAKRCRHVIGENRRTLRAAAALRAGNLSEVGMLMLQSHGSLRDDYAVSCAELDCAVDTASERAGVYGARMTGGGFGGCTVTLLERAAVEQVSASIQRVFFERFGRSPELFVTDATGGVREEIAR